MVTRDLVQQVRQLRYQRRSPGATGPSITPCETPAWRCDEGRAADYAVPAEMTATGELVGGKPHIRARVGTHFARVYLLPVP